MLAICSILIWTYLLITAVYTAWIREWGGGGGGDYLHLCFLEKQISTIGCFFGFIGRLLDWGKIKMSIGEMGKNLRSHTKILGWHTFYTWVLLISKFKFDVIIYYHVWFWGNVYLAWLWFEYLSCLVCDFVIVLPCCDVTINMFIIQFYFFIYKSFMACIYKLSFLQDSQTQYLILYMNGILSGVSLTHFGGYLPPQ